MRGGFVWNSVWKQFVDTNVNYCLFGRNSNGTPSIEYMIWPVFDYFLTVKKGKIYHVTFRIQNQTVMMIEKFIKIWWSIYQRNVSYWLSPSSTYAVVIELSLTKLKKGSNSLNQFINNNAPYTNSLNEETELRLQVNLTAFDLERPQMAQTSPAKTTRIWEALKDLHWSNGLRMTQIDLKVTKNDLK